MRSSAASALSLRHSLMKVPVRAKYRKSSCLLPVVLAPVVSPYRT